MIDSKSDIGFTDFMDDLYAQLDSAAHTLTANALANEPKDENGNAPKITCEKGCAHCCHQLTTVSGPEALHLAVALMRQDRWTDRLPALHRAAREDCAPGFTRGSRFRSMTPCGFLDVTAPAPRPYDAFAAPESAHSYGAPYTGRGTCSVYEQRPACCRFLAVVSDAKHCSPLATDAIDPTTGHPENQTRALNLMELEAVVFQTSVEITKDIGDSSVHAPIAVYVLDALKALTFDDAVTHPLVLEALQGIQAPDAWFWEHMPRLGAEDANEDKDPKVREQLHQIARRMKASLKGTP